MESSEDRTVVRGGAWTGSTRVPVSDRLWLSLVLLAGALVRVYKIDALPADHHFFRQAQTLGTIVTYWRSGIDFLHPVMISMGKPGILVLEFPLYQAIVASLYKLLGPSVVYGRLASIAASVAAAFFVYKIARLFYERREPLYAAAFFLFAPMSIFFGRVPMLEMLEIALCTAYLYYFAAYILEGRVSRLLLAIVLGGLAFVVKPPYALPLVVPLAYLYYVTHGPKLKAGILAGLVAPIAIMFVWQRYANGTNALYNTGRYPYEQLRSAIQVKLWPPNPWYFGTLSQRLQVANYAKVVVRVGAGMLAGVAAVPFLAGLFGRISKRDYVFFAWLLGVAGSFFVFFNLNVVHDYYQFPLLPVTAILCGKGTQVIAERLEVRFGRRAARVCLGAFAVVFALAVIAVVTKVDYFKEIALPQVAVAEEIGDVAPRDSLVAVSTTSGDVWDPTILYFAGRRGYVVPQSRLDSAMLDYLRESGVQYIAVTENGAGLSSQVRSELAGSLVKAAGLVSVYRLTGVR